MTKEILCFHTCNNEGGKEFILERAPFHSDTTKPQWLGQGYYLWTDSDYYAHDWGRQAPRYGNYVITKFKLSVESSYFLIWIIFNNFFSNNFVIIIYIIYIIYKFFINIYFRIL